MLEKAKILIIYVSWVYDYEDWVKGLNNYSHGERLLTLNCEWLSYFFSLVLVLVVMALVMICCKVFIEAKALFKKG